MIKDIFPDSNPSRFFTDDAKEKGLSHIYYPFGNFYDVSYSLGMIYASSLKTREFIAKSMYGYDLLDEYCPISFDFNRDSPIDIKDSKKKYYVGNGTRGTNYIDRLSGTDVNFNKYDNKIVRIEFPDMGNDNLWSCKTLYSYGESEGSLEDGKTWKPNDNLSKKNTYNDGVDYGSHMVYDLNVTSQKEDIINYTNRRFLNGSYDTLISRFHTNYIGLNESRGNRDITSTALSRFGMSHGRNLLKNNPDDKSDNNVNGYDNPYCRVWTYHHQYSKLKDTIRPFDKNDGDLKESGIAFYRTEQSFDKLEKYGVKGANGLVKITPTIEDFTNDDSNKRKSIKNCMFSIENLAWKGEKDFFKGHEDQKGPLGGRIMWFPPYDLRFNENVGVDWSSNQFIGRGERIYTYTNTERTGNISFKLLIDHPSVLNQWRGMGSNNLGDVDDTKSAEQQILRFFAGCELLKVKIPKKEKQEDKPKKVIEQKVKINETTTTTYDELVFYVFFPNNYSGVDDVNSNVKPMEYLINGIGPNKIINNGRNIDYAISIDSGSLKGLGYEMSDSGISKRGSDYDFPNSEKSILNGTDFTDLKIAYQYCRTNKVGKPNYWAYRCDKRYENQVLRPFGETDDKKKIKASTNNYYDSANFDLNNNKGFKDLLNVHTNDKEFYEKGRLFSFADVFCSIQEKGKNFIANDKISEDEIKKIKEILGLNKENYSIETVEIKGFASSHGYKKLNNELGINRGKSVGKWLNERFPNKFPLDIFEYGVNEIGEKLVNYDINSFLAKVWRCVRVAIKIKKEEVVKLTEQVDVEINKENEISYDNITYASNVTNEKIQKIVDVSRDTKATNYEGLGKEYYLKYGEKLGKSEMNLVVNSLENNKSDIHTKIYSAMTNGNTIELSNDDDYGYGSEYKFFSELKDNEPFLHNKIVDKIKYFDPAFHSITPEGFQSRLTFLHQCTRQSNTISASDNSNDRTARNLSFGRPPICVLRVGDFYNTKIIIDSLSINYDDANWDLNDEGIGVMPMIANINISFKFLGGSDLSGPINRLQNALSFNHYANTSLYDNRAEEIEYDDKGRIIRFDFKK